MKKPRGKVLLKRRCRRCDCLFGTYAIHGKVCEGCRVNPGHWGCKNNET